MTRRHWMTKSWGVSIAVVLCITLGGLGAWQVQKSRNEHAVLALLWYQTSAEMRALYYQAYNIARLMLDRSLDNPSAKPRAIITDIDETILDNSPYNARQVFSNEVYPTGWREWVELAQAQALPGAVEFLRYAESKGVHVFYISNRKLEERAATIKNLTAAGFPSVTEERLLLLEKENSKESRRKKISDKYNVVLLLGDNLNDFTDIFERRSVAERSAEVDRLKDEWGRKFIVLPNPYYGDWEAALYEYNFRRSDEEKDRLRKSALRGY
jgi:5'-nucleotidase (lipoprotein e(P4) family)